MNIETARNFLLWCAIINYGLLIVWALLFKFAHDWLYRLNGKWYRLSVEQFHTINYTGIVLFKLGILLFNLVPYVALHVVG